MTGPGGSGLKRDPRARELELHGFPDVDAIVREPSDYPWHDAGFRPPAFANLVLYQLHVGRFYARDDDLRTGRVANFLDAIDRTEYLADLGITAIQPLPVVEYAGEWSLGYDGTHDDAARTSSRTLVSTSVVNRRRPASTAARRRR